MKYALIALLAGFAGGYLGFSGVLAVVLLLATTVLLSTGVYLFFWKYNPIAFLLEKLG